MDGRRRGLSPIIYTLFVVTVPKSPRWLLTKDRTEEARSVLATLNPELTIEKLRADMDEGMDGA